MTLEELEMYHGLYTDIKAMTAEIEELYNTVKSPNGRTEPGHGSEPSNPTARAVDDILEHKAILEQKQRRMMKELKRIDAWLETVPDAELRALIRWYYILGLTWKQTSIKVYGYSCTQRAYQRVHRYFGKNIKKMPM